MAVYFDATAKTVFLEPEKAQIIKKKSKLTVISQLGYSHKGKQKT